MEKTSRELGEKLIDLLKDIKEANSSFKVANLSQQALEVVKEWKQAKELEQKTQEPKPESKDVEIELLGDIVISHYDTGQVFHHLRIKEKDMPHRAIMMAQHFLEAITGVVYKFDDKERLIAHPVGLRNYLVQILEEKFGLTIKICGNCKYYSKSGSFTGGPGCARQGEDKILQNYSGINCKANGFKENLWTPKEIPTEKKEEEKTCGNCGRLSSCFEGCGEYPLESPCDKWIPEKE